MNGTDSRFGWIIAITDPVHATSWSLDEWQRVVRVGRRARLLARIAETLDGAGLLDSVPDLPRRHLLAEQRVSRHRTATMLWAIERIGSVLSPAGVTSVLLKGAAYVGQNLVISKGRLPSDLDILVPRAEIELAQRLLADAGWEEVELNEHDRQYYTRWSHELPPMRHPVHSIELDLHHDILPPTARTRLDVSLLINRRQPCRLGSWTVLQPVDQLLHSAAHLFFDPEVRDRTRDLVDLDGLLREFGHDAAFWDDLIVRAVQLHLVEPLALALHFCKSWLASPVPDAVASTVARQGGRRWRRDISRRVFALSLLPVDPDSDATWRRTLADTFVLARYHHWRLPTGLLLPHLARKALSRARPGVGH